MPESDNNPETSPKAESAHSSEQKRTVRTGDPGLPANAGEALLPGTLIAHRFNLTRLIGRGGMGVVWQAHDNSLGRDVALKFLGNEVAADPEAVADLQRETRRSLELTHPNIVRVYDYVEDPELRLVGISMELLTGRSLQMLKLDQPQRAFAPDKVLPWLRQICTALDYAHQVVGVIHRDLKPGNLFLNDRGTLKIVDFGIAMVMLDSTSRLVQEARLSRSGTLAYMSQQQLKGDKPTPADDLYALGAVLYELFTSKPPFFRGDAHALMMQIMTQPPAPIATRQAEMGITGINVPPGFEAAILACLAKDPAARPTSGGQLLSMIESAPAPIAPVDNNATRLVSNAVPLIPLDPEKTMVVNSVTPPPVLPTTPVLPPPPPPPVAPPPVVPPPVGPDPAAHKEKIVVVHPPEKKKGGVWGWIAMMGELLGLKAAVVAALLLIVTELLSWLKTHNAHSLILKVEPADIGAQIQVDGRTVGPLPATGPLKVPDVADGEHVVTVEARGYRTYREPAKVHDGHGELNVTLLPLVGSLEVSARPGTHLIVQPLDGGKPFTREVGSSGKVTLEGLKAGDVALRMENPDYLPAEANRVSIGADQTTRVQSDQKAIPATVMVRSQPSGATVLINGVARGTTPKEFSDIPAELNVSIETKLEGHEAARGNFTFKPGEHREVPFDLQQIRGTLTVRARPGTHVTARRNNQDQVDLGNVGSSGEASFDGRLAQGKWSISFENPDCQPGTSVDVSIDRDRAVNLTAKQTLLPASLDVRSETSGGTIWINGAMHGTAPTVVYGLPSDTPLNVELRFRGKNSPTKNITLRPKEQGSVMFERVEPDAPPRIVSASDNVLAPTPAPQVVRPAPGYNVPNNNNPYAYPAYPKSSIVPQDADNAGAIELKGTMQNEQLLGAIRNVAQHRGWTVSKIDGNVVVLTLKHHGYDATIYLRCDPHRIDFFSDSYKTGLVGSNAAKQVPTSWIKNVQQDLAKLVR